MKTLVSKMKNRRYEQTMTFSITTNSTGAIILIIMYHQSVTVILRPIVFLGTCTSPAFSALTATLSPMPRFLLHQPQPNNNKKKKKKRNNKNNKNNTNNKNKERTKTEAPSTQRLLAFVSSTRLETKPDLVAFTLF